MSLDCAENQQNVNRSSSNSNHDIAFSRVAGSDEAYASQERDRRDYAKIIENMRRYSEFEPLKNDIS